MEIRKFGAYISKLRKEHDLTQSQLADVLNVTRQAVSKWEMGDSFPDISLLPRLAELFQVTVDQLINYGEPPNDDSTIVTHLAKGRPEKVADMLQSKRVAVDSVVKVAPMLKASTLDTIMDGYDGIEIRHLVELATYMNQVGLTNLLKKASLGQLDENMLEQFSPFLDEESKNIIFHKIIAGELSGSLLAVMIPYLDPGKYYSLIEAAILEGLLEPELLKIKHRENN